MKFYAPARHQMNMMVAPPRGGAWIEMVLSISNGMLFSFLVHRIVSFPVIHLAEQKSPYYTASFCATDLSSTACA